jgi:hypothetical protein
VSKRVSLVTQYDQQQLVAARLRLVTGNRDFSLECLVAWLYALRL